MPENTPEIGWFDSAIQCARGGICGRYEMLRGGGEGFVSAPGRMLRIISQHKDILAKMVLRFVLTFPKMQHFCFGDISLDVRCLCNCSWLTHVSNHSEQNFQPWETARNHRNGIMQLIDSRHFPLLKNRDFFLRKNPISAHVRGIYTANKYEIFILSAKRR